jgi:putative oxidoreductase
MDLEYKYYLIELIPRVFCGIIFLFQGYDKLFNVKIQGVVETFLFETRQRHVPKILLHGMAVFVSNVEFVGGALLILGLFKTAILTLFGLDLIFVAIAFSYMNPVWDMKHVFPRLILILVLFVMPDRWNYS